jgi:hypothetical protein
MEENKDTTPAVEAVKPAAPKPQKFLAFRTPGEKKADIAIPVDKIEKLTTDETGLCRINGILSENSIREVVVALGWEPIVVKKFEE